MSFGWEEEFYEDHEGAIDDSYEDEMIDADICAENGDEEVFDVNDPDSPIFDPFYELEDRKDDIRDEVDDRVSEEKEVCKEENDLSWMFALMDEKKTSE